MSTLNNSSTPVNQVINELDSTLTGDDEVINTRTVVKGEDQNATYNDISAVSINGKTSLYTVNGFTNTDSIHLDVSLATTTTTAYMLIDLSDTTNWKHTNTGGIVIEYIILEVDPGTTFSGQVKLGYLSNVDATNGDVTTIFNVDMRRSASLLVENLNFGSHGLRCSSNTHFGPTESDSTLFQTDVNLEGPDGNSSYPSGDGDVVMIISGANTGNGAVNVSVTIGYETVDSM